MIDFFNDDKNLVILGVVWVLSLVVVSQAFGLLTDPAVQVLSNGLSGLFGIAVGKSINK